MTTFTPAACRAIVAAGVPVLVLWALDSRLNPEQGPDIGGGFILLLALFAVPLVWAWFDGRRRGPRPSLVIWGTAAALVFVADAVRFMTSGGFHIADTGEALFLATFLAAPFLAGGCFGALLGSSASRTQRP